MFNPQNHSDKSKTIFMQSVEALANLSAFVAAFFLAPEVYVRTIAFVIEYTRQRYGYGFDEPVMLVWFVVVTLIVFFGARATIATAIVAGGLTLASRFI